MFKKQYALLTNEQLSEFVHWITDLRDQFSSKGVDVLKIIYTDCLAIIDNPEVAPELSPLRENVPLHLVNEEYDADDAIKCSNNTINNVNDTVSKLHGCNECNFVPDLSANGEIFLDVDEWNSIHFIDIEGRDKLNRDWTVLFSSKVSKIYPMCVLKFNNYWFKKISSRKVNSPYFRACADCKFLNCYSLEFYIDENMTCLPGSTNTLAVHFISKGSLSVQHNNGENKYARHVSGIQRTHLGGILQHTSVSKYFHKQFGCMDNVVEYCSGNFSHLKTQDCLRQIKFEVNSSNRFSNDMVTDISATQEYYRNLLNEKPIPGYVQYFVKEPFIIHLYTMQQIELLKLLNKGIILHLDATGSLISKPQSCTKPIYYYALTLQHPDYHTSPIPVAEMISSDHGTAEISHFLNKWYLNSKLVLNKEIHITRIEIDYSWAMIHSACIAFNKVTF